MSEFSQNLAIVIGINEYGGGIPPLQTAANDVREIARILQDGHGYEVMLFVDGQATLAALRHLLENELPKRTQADGRMLFYFAGHGIALNGEDGPEGYLIPQDAKLGDTDTYLLMPKLQTALSELPCRHFLGVLDCCFAGAFRWSSTRDLLSVPKVIHKERYDRFIRYPAWQVITSAASDQKALDSLTLNTDRGQAGNHSPFASALIAALKGQADAHPPATNGKPQGDGVITATELYLYLRDAVEPASEEIRHRQTPGIWPLKKHDKGEYIFLTPGHVLNLPPAPPLDESKNPYRGLESFDEAQSELFFGRQALTEKLAEFVSQQPLTVVLGASGSGKSSLVKAGLIPCLKQQGGKADQQQWQFLPPMRLGDSPFKALSKALTEETLLNVTIPKPGTESEAEMLTQYLAAWSQQCPGSKLLLVIDQFEELITLCRDEQERGRFLDGLALAESAPQTQLHLVLTLRSDFEPQFQDAALKGHWGAARFVVPPMTRAELREAIEEPASKRVMYFQSDDPKKPLIDQLIDEVAEMPGALPLLSFTLSELYLKYLKRQGIAKNRGDNIERSILESDYQELGGVARSLTQRADQEYDAIVRQDPAYGQTIPHVMLRMVAVGGGELARRRVPLSELEYPPPQNDRVKNVIKQFSAARLLVEGNDAEGKPYAEPAHDALVRGWQKLLAWKQEREEDLILQRRLTPAAEEWKSQDKLKFLWDTNPRLDLLKKVLSTVDNWLNNVEAEFVQRSIARKIFKTRRNWGIAIAVMLGLSWLTIIALNEQRDAQIGQITASRQAAESGLLSNQELDALINSLQAAKTLKYSRLLRLFKPDMPLEEQVKFTLQKAVYQAKEKNRINIQKGADKVVFSPDGKLIATVQEDGLISFLDQSGKPSTEFTPISVEKDIDSISFSPDSQQLITVSPVSSDSTDSTNKVVTWWNLKGEPLNHRPMNTGSINTVMLGSNGRLMIFNDNKLRDLESETQLAEFHDEIIGYNQFSPDGKLRATGVAGDGISISNVDSKKKIVEIKDAPSFDPNSDIPNSISFSPDSKLIAAAESKHGIIYLWDLKGNQLAKFTSNQGGVENISFSPDGKQLATIGIDGTLRIWQGLKGKQLTELILDQDVSNISVSSDGQLLAASNSQGLILWDFEKQQRNPFPNQFADISELHFCADKHLLALSENNGIIHWLDLKNQQHIDTFQGNDIGSNQHNFSAHNYGGNYQGLSLSGDGNLLAIGGDNTVIVRSRNGKPLVTFPEGPDSEEGEMVKNWVEATAFDPSGNRLATSTVFGQVRLWEWKERKQILSKPIQANISQTRSIVFNPKGDQIATAGLDGSASGVRLWDIPSGNKLAEFIGHSDFVKQVTFSPDGSLLATAGYDGTARVWNLSGQQLAEFKGLGRVLKVSLLAQMANN